MKAGQPQWNGIISVWDASGSYLRSFGSEGQGPGEFTVDGMLTLFIDGRDNVHVRDGSFTWSVFSPEHVFLSKVSAKAMGGLPNATVVLDNGSVLASDHWAGHPSQYFRIVDATGAPQLAFAPVDVSDWSRRPISYAGGDIFWAGPPIGGGGMYVLEEWGVDGKLRRTFEREASWWQWRGDPAVSSVVSQVHIARNGFLYVLSRQPTQQYVSRLSEGRYGGAEAVAGPQRTVLQREQRDAGTEVVVEIIDTQTGRLLASGTYPTLQARELFPRYLFRGSLAGYRYRVEEDGLPQVEIVTVELVPK